jgi:hypothetical protein
MVWIVRIAKRAGKPKFIPPLLAMINYHAEEIPKE